MAEIDLNLLRVFDALMELRSVTRVADRLGLTQSAVSHALGRLRRMLDDPLFVRSPRGLQPSARAEQIAPGITASLQQLRDALAPAQFTPASATRNFTIAAGTYFCTLIIPPLLERLRSDAPNVSLRVVPLIEDGTTMLDRGLIDLALGAMQDLPSRFVVEPLFEDDMVWIAARSNPLADQVPDLGRIMRHPRVRMVTRRPFSTPRTLDDDAVVADHQSIGWDPEPAGNAPTTVYDSQTAAAVVARTDMVACIPRRIAEGERQRDDIIVLMPATRAETISLAMIWHSRNRSDSAITWLRELVSNAARGEPPLSA
ncbi:LysR substrate-binding domain-containing protein [Novosphingobium sp. BL-8A]|uniref:LysR family transcriptional regulator n=1 Tax=Novosphingobium sp. BL-8A TaxID=3127639 RepID=UPI0037563AE6